MSVARLVGAPVRRFEHLPLLRGEASFVADLEPPGTLHVAVVRSPYAHARVLGVDLSQARAQPGIVEAVSAFDLDSLPNGPIPVRLGPRPELEPFRQHALAFEKVRYVGEPVAVVVAESRYLAEDAAAYVEVEYEPLEAVVDALAAADPAAPLLFEEAGSNVVLEIKGEHGDVEAAFGGAAVVVSHRFVTNRHSAVPMETRGLVALYEGEELTVWGPTKALHAHRHLLSQVLGLQPDRIRVIEPSIGGGFGVRGEPHPEDIFVPALAIRLGRPVKWIEDRTEHLTTANQSREQVHDAELALDADGTIRGLRSRFVVDNGAYVRALGVRIAEITAHTLAGPYRVPAHGYEGRTVVTNKAPIGVYRAPGRFEANFVRERLLDLAARRLGLDPVGIRRRNLLRPADLPYEPGGVDFGRPIVYTTGDPPRLLDLALEAVGYEALRRDQAERRTGTRRLGVGMACFMEDGGVGGVGPTPGEYARVLVDGEGSIVVFSGASDLGQGFRTVLAQVCADELGVAFDEVEVVLGDTGQVESGGGTWGSRGAILAGNSTLLATRALRERLHDEGVRLLGAAPEDVEVGGGRVSSPAGSLSFGELAAAAEVPLEGSCVFGMEDVTYSPGAHAVAVEVDEETGQVVLLRQALAYDVGRAINPAAVEAQIQGGLAQGLGGALLEEFVYDETGQPLATSFMDYLLPSAAEMAVEQKVIVTEDGASAGNPLGVKAVGEVGPPGAGAAIGNAVADALAPLEIAADHLPLSPDRVLGSIADARLAALTGGGY